MVPPPYLMSFIFPLTWQAPSYTGEEIKLNIGCNTFCCFLGTAGLSPFVYATSLQEWRWRDWWEQVAEQVRPCHHWFLLDSKPFFQLFHYILVRFSFEIQLYNHVLLQKKGHLYIEQQLFSQHIADLLTMCLKIFLC